MKPFTGTAAWHPIASTDALQARAGMLARIREFFAVRKVLEVETPVLSRAGNSDPCISQLQTSDTTPYWLRTSPEYAMKRLLAAGSGDIYELGRVFRAGESGRHHNHEFTMLEWYRVDWTYHRLMDEVAELVRWCCEDVHMPEQRMSYRQLFQEFADIDPLEASTEELRHRAEREGIDAPALDRNEWLDLVLTHMVQPRLPLDGMTFVFDYPQDQAALAKVRPGSPPLAERFELFLGQSELANGYQELTDAAEQRCRFEKENRLRSGRGEAAARLDENLIEALEHGLPECAGVALGVDRLLMYLLRADSLSELLAFPADRA